MTTARDLITLSMREVGVLGLGQTLNDEDVNNGFTILKNMIAQWQRRRWLVPSLFDISMPGNSEISNKIGNGQYYNTPRPDKIQSGYVVQLNSGSTPVSLPLLPIFSYEDYVRIAVKSLNTLPSYFFYDAAFPYGNVYFWPIPNSNYEIHLILKSSIFFTTGIAAGGINFAGAGYTDGTYLDVPLIGGTGSGATVNITVVGGSVTVVGIAEAGDNYTVNDLLSVFNTNVGGTGTGFSYKVEATDSLDSEINLPPEYEEALYYNLAIRLSSMYQMPPNLTTVALAKAALNTLRKANVQVPALIMPPGLIKGRAFNIYNADNY